MGATSVALPYTVSSCAHIDIHFKPWPEGHVNGQAQALSLSLSFRPSFTIQSSLFHVCKPLRSGERETEDKARVYLTKSYHKML